MSVPRTNGPDARASAPWRSGLALASAVLAAVALLGAIERLTDEPIARARATRLADTLAEVVPDTAFDNDPVGERRLVRLPAHEADALVPVHPLRLGGRPVGAVLGAVAPDGYGGPIRLLVGLDSRGRVTGVRVTEHRETPGLGDRIERRRSRWITRFDGRALAPDDPDAWRVTRGVGGGGFDALTGATITSRAVVDAVRRTLVRFESDREAFLAGEPPR